MTLRAGRRYKLRFNVSGFDAERLRIVTDGERIIVRGTKLEESQHGVTSEREYEKKIEKPKEVNCAGIIASIYMALCNLWSMSCARELRGMCGIRLHPLYCDFMYFVLCILLTSV